MSEILVAALSSRYGLAVVDGGTVDAFLAGGGDDVDLLFFSGDPAQRNDSGDVAVVLPELLRAFPGRLRAAVVARTAEAGLQKRFGVQVFPSIAVVRAGRTVAVLARIRDWAEYLATIATALAGGTVEAAPRVVISHSTIADANADTGAVLKD